MKSKNRKKLSDVFVDIYAKTSKYFRGMKSTSSVKYRVGHLIDF